MRIGAISMLSTGLAAVVLAVGCSDHAESGADTEPAVRKPEAASSQGAKKTGKRESRAPKRRLGLKRKAALPVRTPEKRSFDGLNPKLLGRLTQSAIDRKDLKTLSSFAERARNSEDPKVRAVIVEALGCFERDALPDLVMFINDDDPGVSGAALRLVDLHFDGIGNDRDKATLIETALRYAQDGMVDVLVSKFDDMDRRESFLKIMSLMDGYADDPVVSEALVRQYEFISGEKYTGKSAAHKWFFATEKKRLKSQK